MYSIILNNGKTMEINADKVEWFGRENMSRFLYKGDVVARINMSAVVGWVITNHIVKNEEGFIPQYKDLEDWAIKTTGSCPKEVKE